MLSSVLLFIGILALGWCIPNYLLMVNPGLEGSIVTVALESAIAFGLISQYFIF